MTPETRFNVLGETFEVLVSSQRSGNAFAMGVQICKPGGGPPPHMHHNEDEYLLPLEGHFEIFDGKRWQPLSRQGIWLPRRQIHTFRNAGSTMGRILGIATPGGLDAYLHAISTLQLPADMNRLISTSEDFGIVFCDAPQTV